MVQSVGSPYTNYGYPASPQQAAPVGNAPPAGYNAYQQDGWSGQTYAASAPVSMAASGSISSIVGDSSAASRMSLFFINSPQRLLSVGAGMGSVGRTFINLLAGNVPLFTSSAKAQQISTNVRHWISSADLVRTGASAFHTALLQDVGIWNARDLAMLVNPMDQSVLAQRLQAAAAARGTADFPTPQMVGSWVGAATQLPFYNF